jgi:hypothetical protein
MGPPPAVGGRSSSTLIAVVLVVVLAIGGIAFAVSADGDDEGGVAAGPEAPDVTLPGAGGLDPEDPIGDGGDLPPADSGAGDDGGTGVEPPDDEPAPEVTEPPLQPAEAEVHDCIAVTSDGYFNGTGSCNSGGTPYTVTEVVDGSSSCSNPEAAYTPSGDYLLCLEVNLVLNYCYVFPTGVNQFVTVASACEAPGTVHVIDIVPGVDTGDYCTNEYEWNRWYSFTAPVLVACVMEY